MSGLTPSSFTSYGVFYSPASAQSTSGTCFLGQVKCRHGQSAQAETVLDFGLVTGLVYSMETHKNVLGTITLQQKY